MDAREPRRWGLCVELAGLSLAQHQDALKSAESAGFTDLWSGETAGHDGFTVLALAAAWTERMRLGTGIVNVFTRGPAVLAQHAAALQEASGGRFALGLGSSTQVIVEGWNGIEYARPRTRVRETVEFVSQALAGQRASPRFRLARPPDSRIPIMIAALRARMLETAAELGDGVFLNLAPIDGMPQLIEHIRAGARAAGKSFDEVELLCHIPCVPGSGRAAEQLARRLLVEYATVPAYSEYYSWLGYGEALEPVLAAWRERDRPAAENALPLELLNQIFAFGHPEQQRAHVERMVAAGVTCPVLMPIIDQPSHTGYQRWIEAMGPG
jgi:probable F420-dependent oxidoreductase